MLRIVGGNYTNNGGTGFTLDHGRHLRSAAYIVEELASLFDEARADGRDHIESMVGSKFERRVRAALALLQREGVEGEPPEIE